MVKQTTVQSQSITFTVPGKPQGKARARTVTMPNGFSHTFTPDKTVLYENLIKTQFAEAEKERGGRFYLDADTPVQYEITAYFRPPASESFKRRRLMLMNAILPLKKPDLDNVLKVIEDALNGLAYHDDKQVCYIHITKRHSSNERVEVTVSEYKPKQTGNAISTDALEEPKKTDTAEFPG